MVDHSEVGIEHQGESELDITANSIEIQSPSEDHSESDSAVVKAQIMTVWNREDKSWKESVVTFAPPHLTITECRKVDPKVLENQMRHLNQQWYHGGIGRRDARHILMDFKDGRNAFLVRESQTCSGKFAVSVRYYNRVIHVMVKNRPHPLTRVVYSISESGPHFNSLYDLVEECMKSSLIHNEFFDIKLGRSAPKFDRSWYDRRLKTHRDAEESFSDEHREGAFCVYQTDPDTNSYNITYRAEGVVHHVQILPTVMNHVAGYIFNNIFSPVMYKIVHYFMENPIQGDTVLKYPVGDLKLQQPLCGVAVRPSLPPDLTFPSGAIVRNICCDEGNSREMCGDYGDVSQKRFLARCVRLLGREELAYLETENLHKAPVECQETGTDQSHSGEPNSSTLTESSQPLTAQLNVQDEFKVRGKKKKQESNVIAIAEKKGRGSSYKLQCSSSEDCDAWMNLLHSCKKSNTRPTQQAKSCLLS